MFMLQKVTRKCRRRQHEEMRARYVQHIEEHHVVNFDDYLIVKISLPLLCRRVLFIGSVTLSAHCSPLSRRHCTAGRRADQAWPCRRDVDYS